MSEFEIQIAVAKLLDLSGLLWMHPPNEGRRARRNGALAVALGLRKGAPDVLIFEPLKSGEHGLALELKAMGGRLSPYQRLWLERLQRSGWRAIVCEGLDAALAALRDAYPGRIC